MPHRDSPLVRVGVYYDGNFLFHVSNYYLHHHERRARVSIGGLHDFILAHVAAAEQADPRRCRIVEARYFRGRLRAADAVEREALYKERVFDDVLARAGVATHYSHQAREGERGVEVPLALEALEAAMLGKFDVLALMAGDGDLLPLIRKLHARGVRTMVLAWDFRSADHNGADRETRTAQALIDEACYPVLMHEHIDDRARAAQVQQLFVPRRDAAAFDAPAPPANGSAPRGAGFRAPPAPLPPPTGPAATGVVDAIRNGYGFIHPDDGGPNLFFLYQEVTGSSFADLAEGDPVEFMLGMNERGPCARAVRKLEGEAHRPDDDGFGGGIDGDRFEHDALSEVPRHDDDDEEINGNR